MAWVERRTVRVSQPQDACGIDWSNPLTKGLILADAMPQIGGSPNLVEPAYLEFISGTVANAVKPNGRGISTSATTTSLKSYGPVGRIAPPLTLMAIYRVYATGTSRNVGNLSASSYGYGLASTTNYRGILSRSGANTILTGSAVVIGLSKTDFLTADATNAEFWENGSRTAGPTAHGGVATAIGAFRIGADNAPAAAANQEVFATALWTRKLAAFEIKSLSDNPWQIFEPEVQRIWIDDATSVSLPTLVQPNSTTAAGAWTATGAATLHEAINETVASDAEYISVNAASTTELVLAEAAYPGASNQTLAYRASSTQGSTLTVTLKQGATQIMTRTHSLTGTDTLYTQTLTAPEIALITAGPISVTLTTS